MKILYILRGVPGCGKSTLAKTLSDNICEADNYFRKDGVYKFDATKLGAAHEYCRTLCLEFMRHSVPKIVVSNTNTTHKEFVPYVNLAREYGYTVFVMTVENYHRGQNEHGVPPEKIETMKTRLKNSIMLWARGV